MKFRNDIQGLRAVAVLFVFIFHLSYTYLPGGFVGVDIFFVISGYLISRIIQHKIEKQGFSLVNFYEGRVKRIVPAYYFMLICSWVLFMFIFSQSEVGKFKLAHFHAILFNSNNYFAKVDDYFGASNSETPFLHTWTLAVEMQFYFILPLLLIFIKNVKHLLLLLVILTTILLGYSSYEIYDGNKAEMYFSLLSRSAEFFFGVILSLIKIEDKSWVKNSANALSISGLSILLLSAFYLTESTPFPGVTSLIPCFGVALILISPYSKVNVFLSNKAFVYLGEISYSIYLWHWPIMAFYRYTNERYEFSLLESIIVVFLTIIACLVSYYGIERPMRDKKGIAFYMPFILMVVLNVAMVFYILPVKNKISNIPSEYLFPNFGVDSHGKDFVRVDVFGDSTYQGKRILFLGDSHALTLKPYLDKLGKENGFSFRTITNDAYPAIPFIKYNDIKEPFRLSIYKNLEPYINSEFKIADIIIVYFAEDGVRWKSAIEKMMSSINSTQKVLFISDYPSVDINPVRKTKGFIKNVNDRTDYQLIETRLSTDILNIIDRNENSRYIDLSEFNDFFKDAPFLNDTLIYYDSGHLNRFGALKYAEYSGYKVVKEIKQALK